jgi:ABC-2 type transport system permease protein
MKLVFAHARAMTIELVRYPAFSVPTLASRRSSFLVCRLTARTQRHAPACFFAGVALLAVALFQFGVGVAAERETPWEQFLRTLPVHARSARCPRALRDALRSGVGPLVA